MSDSIGGPTVLRDSAQQVDVEPHSSTPSWEQPVPAQYWPPHPLAAGQVWRTRSPFFQEPVARNNYEDIPERRWIPGQLRYEDGGSHFDAEGYEVREIVSLHRPGRFPTRVFYQRWWVLNGRRFGKTTCRVATQGTFRRWLCCTRGPFRYQRGELVGDGTGRDPSPPSGVDAVPGGRSPTEGMNQ